MNENENESQSQSQPLHHRAPNPHSYPAVTQGAQFLMTARGFWGVVRRPIHELTVRRTVGALLMNAILQANQRTEPGHLFITAVIQPPDQDVSANERDPRAELEARILEQARAAGWEITDRGDAPPLLSPQDTWARWLLHNRYAPSEDRSAVDYAGVLGWLTGWLMRHPDVRR